MAMKGWKGEVFKGLAALKIFFPVSEIFLKIFSGSAAGGAEDPGPDRVKAFDMT